MFSFFNKGEEEDLRYYYNVYIMYYIMRDREVPHANKTLKDDGGFPKACYKVSQRHKSLGT